MIYFLAGSLLVILVLLQWWSYNEGWERGYGYGHSAGLLADDKLNITLEEWK